jgi:hypothetical protein
MCGFAPPLLLDKVIFICTIDRMDRRLCTVCTGHFMLPVRLTAIGLQGSNKKCWLNLVLDDSSVWVQSWVQTWGESRRKTRQERKNIAPFFFQIFPRPIAIPFGPYSSPAVLRAVSSSATLPYSCWPLRQLSLSRPAGVRGHEIQYMCNVTLRRVRATIVAVEKH